MGLKTIWKKNTKLPSTDREAVAKEDEQGEVGGTPAEASDGSRIGA